MTSKVFAFCVEPTAFSPVIDKIDKIAIERHTSRSEVIVDILFRHFGMRNDNANRTDRMTMDFSKHIMKRSGN
jgi:hypothetical protein